MNSKNANRRLHRTRILLQEAPVSLILEKGYEKITVQKDIERANVGRSTFYAHFQEMDDLLLGQVDGLREQFDQHSESQPPPAADPWKLTLLKFQHLLVDRTFHFAL